MEYHISYASHVQTTSWTTMVYDTLLPPKNGIKKQQDRQQFAKIVHHDCLYRTVF